MLIESYLTFNGNCAEAMRFYERTLGGKIEMMMTHGQAPDQSRVKPAWKNLVLHARILLGGTALAGADIPKAEPMRSAYLTLGVDSDSEAERIFSSLSDGGQVLMPMEETFFASRFAMLRDKFGTSWMLLHPKPQRG